MRSHWLPCVSTVFLAACAGSRSATETEARSSTADGQYEYSASIPSYQPGRTLRVTGSLAIVGDSLFVYPGSGCTVTRHNRSAIAGTSPGSAAVNCAGASLSFDARNMRSGRWVTVVPVPKQRNVCVEYEPRDPARTRRCIRYRPETYYESQQRSGVVQIKRLS